MSFSPVPDYSFQRLTDITPQFLKTNGITLLMMDLDNTISTYALSEPTDDIYAWIAEMKAQNIDLFIISNNRTNRAERFARSLQLPFINSANKPSTRGIRRILEQTGKTVTESALVGDQTYTDVLAANRMGMLSIAVRPLCIKNPFLAIRYFTETPFRMMCKNKTDRTKIKEGKKCE